jgi:predicted nucleotidyltransferase
MKNNSKTSVLWQNIMENTILTRVLSFLSEHPNKAYTGTEIADKLKNTRMAIFLSLKDLSKDGLVEKESRGKTYLYKIDQGNPIVKQFKVLRNIIELEPLINKLKLITKKIILFGSASRGEDTAESDVDFLIITNDIDSVQNMIQGYRFKREIEPKIFTPVGLATLREKEKVFYNEIDRGITLWEGE